ncbi:MAG: YchJ family protein, partial [Rhodoferax sp.]
MRPKVRSLPAGDNGPCPCGASNASNAPYSLCCAPFHQGLVAQPPLHAPTPEALMRSRYSAYVMGLHAYLLATWHGSTAPGELDAQPVKWLGLEVLHAAEQGDAGVVEFVARYRDLAQGGRAQRLHERSRFVREAGRWLYIDGVM